MYIRESAGKSAPPANSSIRKSKISILYHSGTFGSFVETEIEEIRKKRSGSRTEKRLVLFSSFSFTFVDSLETNRAGKSGTKKKRTLCRISVDTSTHIASL